MDEYVVMWVGNDGVIGRTIKCGTYGQAVYQGVELAKENRIELENRDITYLEENGRLGLSGGHSICIGLLESPS